jgi:uncharacterized protein
MKKYIFGVFLIGILSMPSFAEVAKPETIKLLMEKTGSEATLKQTLNYMIPMLKRMVPSAPESFSRSHSPEWECIHVLN